MGGEASRCGPERQPPIGEVAPGAYRSVCPGIEDFAPARGSARLRLLLLLRRLLLLLRLAVLRTVRAAAVGRAAPPLQRDPDLVLCEGAQPHLVVAEPGLLEKQDQVLALPRPGDFEGGVPEQGTVVVPHLDARGLAHDEDRRWRRRLRGLRRRLLFAPGCNHGLLRRRLLHRRGLGHDGVGRGGAGSATGSLGARSVK